MTVQLSRGLSDAASRMDEKTYLAVLNREVVPYLRELGRAVQALSSGDVFGPAGATDHAVARYDTATGKLIQNSVVTVSDAGAISGVNTLAASFGITCTTVNGKTVRGYCAEKNGSSPSSTSVTLADITGLSAFVLPVGTYVFRYVGHYSTAVNTTGIRFGVAFTGSSSGRDISLNVVTGAAGATESFNTTALATGIGSTTGPGAALVPFELYGGLFVSVQGSLSFQFATEVAASSVTIGFGSVAHIMETSTSP